MDASCWELLPDRQGARYRRADLSESGVDATDGAPALVQFLRDNPAVEVEVPPQVHRTVETQLLASAHFVRVNDARYWPVDNTRVDARLYRRRAHRRVPDFVMITKAPEVADLPFIRSYVLKHASLVDGIGDAAFAFVYDLSAVRAETPFMEIARPVMEVHRAYRRVYERHLVSTVLVIPNDLVRHVFTFIFNTMYQPTRPYDFVRDVADAQAKIEARFAAWSAERGAGGRPR